MRISIYLWQIGAELVRYYLREIQHRERSITERLLTFLLILRCSEFEKTIVFEFVFSGHIVDNMAYLPYSKYRKRIGDYNG